MTTSGRRRSIRATLLLWLLPVAMLFMVLAWMIHGALLERMSRDFFEYRLEQESRLIRQQLEATYPQVNMHSLHHTFALDRYHHTFAVRVGEQVWAADAAMGRELLQATRGRRHTLLSLESRDSRYLAYRDSFSVGGLPAEVVVAEDVDALESAQKELHLWVGVVSLVLLGLLVAMIILAVHLATRPLTQLGREVRGLNRGERTRLSEAVPAEFRELVQQLNSLLDRLDRQLEGSREAIANLSHSVKTPVSALMHWLDNPDMVMDAATREQMLARMRELHQQLESQMRRSRLSGPQAGQTAVPEAQTRDMLWMLGRLYPDRTFEFNTDFDPATRWPVEEQDFNELVGNLADNAGKWAARHIVVGLGEEDGAMTIRVEDDGPGVPPEDRGQLGTRGHRLDEQVKGHGLGLAIVRDIVERYGGQLEFAQSPALGGLQVTVTLPFSAET